MGRYVACLGEDLFCEWSSVVDAPVTDLMSRMRAERAFGADRVRRAAETGTSALDLPRMLPQEIIAGNRAGPDESALDLDELIVAYRPR